MGKLYRDYLIASDLLPLRTAFSTVIGLLSGSHANHSRYFCGLHINAERCGKFPQ
jgi:hypothetical protein